MSALDVNSLLFEEKPLYIPKLDEIRDVLNSQLSKNFKDAAVEIVDCPNLQQEPFNLANSALGGSPALIEVGGAPYLLPLVDETKIYDIKEILLHSFKTKGKTNIFGIGAGAGPFPLRSTNCEGIFNINVGPNGEVKNSTYTAKIHGPQEDCVLEKVPNNDTRFAVLGNIFACTGEPGGKVLRVECKQRTGSLNFIESIRIALSSHFKEKCVGLGGIFLLKKGKAKQHVMRDFSKTPIYTEEELNNWLKFFDMPATLNAVGTLVTHENDLDLRLQHFHSFSNSNWGGHYHIDTTPDIVEYEGYFNVTERVIRVDKPVNTHKFGRD